MPKYNKKRKERIELFLDKEKDAAIIEYMDKYATTRAGFVRHVLHEYVKMLVWSLPLQKLKQLITK